MYAFLILVALALGLSVVRQALDELAPVTVPASLTRVVTIAVAAGLAWMLGYSAFTAFAQDLRADWMHPVVTGIVLVAIGEFTRSIVDAIGHRAETPAAPAVPAQRAARAA